MPPAIVAELLDVHDVEIAPSSSLEDFVVSERLTSLMLSQLSQLSEIIELEHVFKEFFVPDGVEIATRPMCEYVAVGGPVRVRGLVVAAAARDEIFIGYRRADGTGTGAVVVNPAKSEELVAAPSDDVIVVTRRGRAAGMRLG